MSLLSAIITNYPLGRIVSLGAKYSLRVLRPYPFRIIHGNSYLHSFFKGVRHPEPDLLPYEAPKSINVGGD